MQKLRIGVIGLGFIGALHARILHEIPNAELVAVADVDEAKALGVAKRYHCAGYQAYETMIRSEALDAVSICSPDPAHMAAATCAAGNGLNILLEKPMANTEQQAQAIKDVVEAAGGRLMVAHLLHFDPRYAILRQAARSGQLGEVIHLHFRRTNPRSNGRRLGGETSIFWYIGIHDFEMMLACAGSKPTRVYSQQVSKINADIGCEDSVFSTVNFANGALGMVELSWALPQNSALAVNSYAEVVGTKAAGYVNILDQGISIYTAEDVLYPDTSHWPEYNGQIQGDLRQEIQHFVDATLGNQPYVTDTDNAIAAVRVVQACFESIRKGLPVVIP